MPFLFEVIGHLCRLDIVIKYYNYTYDALDSINLIASPTVRIFSASLSDISDPNSSSNAITNSTVSKLSAPKSSIKLESSFTFASSTP